MDNYPTAMESFCIARGLAVDEWVREIGSALNFQRKKFLSLIFPILKAEVKTLVVAHKERLCRFAFEFIEELAASQKCEIIVANQAC